MKFYTNIYTHGNQILERYVEDGERKQRKVDYEPTLYVNSTKQTPFKTINGKQVEPRRFDSCLLYTSPSPRDQRGARMPSSA